MLCLWAMSPSTSRPLASWVHSASLITGLLEKIDTSRMPCTEPVCSETTTRGALTYSRLAQVCSKSFATASTPSRRMNDENHWAAIFSSRASISFFSTSGLGKKPAHSVPAKPSVTRSSSRISSVFHSPTSGMSSLRQLIGCMPQVRPLGSLIAVSGDSFFAIGSS